jgi:hypothetical protein
MNANSSIAAALFRFRFRKQGSRGLQAILDRQFEPWLSELAMRTNTNPTFKFALVQHEH